MTMDFSYQLCVCVSTNYLTMDLPLPLKKSMVVKQFQMHSYAICSLLEVLLTTVDVHGRTHRHFLFILSNSLFDSI